MIPFLGQMTVSDAGTFAVIVGGVYVLVQIGDRLWKQKANGKPKIDTSAEAQNSACLLQHGKIQDAMQFGFTETHRCIQDMSHSIDRLITTVSEGTTQSQSRQATIVANQATIIARLDEVARK